MIKINELLIFALFIIFLMLLNTFFRQGLKQNLTGIQDKDFVSKSDEFKENQNNQDATYKASNNWENDEYHKLEYEKTKRNWLKYKVNNKKVFEENKRLDVVCNPKEGTPCAYNNLAFNNNY